MPIYFAIFITDVWSYLLWSPVTCNTGWCYNRYRCSGFSEQGIRLKTLRIIGTLRVKCLHFLLFTRVYSTTEAITPMPYTSVVIFVKVLVRWAKGKRLTDRLPSLSLMTAFSDILLVKPAYNSCHEQHAEIATLFWFRSRKNNASEQQASMVTCVSEPSRGQTALPYWGQTTQNSSSLSPKPQIWVVCIQNGTLHLVFRVKSTLS